MSPVEVILRLSLVAILAAYLLAMHRRPSPRPPERSSATPWTGTGFEAGAVSLRIRRLRMDDAGALMAMPHPRVHPERLLTSARRALLDRPYFREKAEGAATPEPDRTVRVGENATAGCGRCRPS